MASDQGPLDEILFAVRRAGKRVTGAKRTVAEVLLLARGDLTAEALTNEVQARRREVSPSTVYRILEEFEALHLVVHAHLGHSAAVYHLAGPVHGHLICGVCAATIEVPAEAFDELGRALSRGYGFHLDRHHVALSGTCAYCHAHS